MLCDFPFNGHLANSLNVAGDFTCTAATERDSSTVGPGYFFDCHGMYKSDENPVGTSGRIRAD
ncbi:MAG: hypothetical protein H6Q05_4744 [Acidobacteria bacterium]|nr:hypothetical protein [Acidobacteriota bacterium]